MTTSVPVRGARPLVDAMARRAKTTVGVVLLAAASALLLPWVLADGAKGVPAGEPLPLDPPVVRIEAPAALARVGSAFVVEGTVTADHDVDRVEVRLDQGPWILASGSSRWSAVIDAADVEGGEHVLHARAMALDGRTTAASVAVVVNDGAGSHGLVTGVVFEDVDRDGTRDPGEDVMPGISVDLLTAAGEHFAGVSTDETGRYVFTDLASGAYRVAVAASSWWELRTTWVLTSGTSPRPDVAVDLDRLGEVDFGWRRFTETDAAVGPTSAYGADEGPYVEVFNDAVEARTLHALLSDGLVGSEASAIRIRVGLSPVDGVTLDAGREGHPVTISMSYASWVENGPATLVNLYGRAWGLVHAELRGADPGLRSYLTARGIFGDDRLRSGPGWDPIQLLAEDYRKLLGPDQARSSPHANPDVVPSGKVPGLARFLRDLAAGDG